MKDTLKKLAILKELNQTQPDLIKKAIKMYNEIYCHLKFRSTPENVFQFVYDAVMEKINRENQKNKNQKSKPKG